MDPQIEDCGAASSTTVNLVKFVPLVFKGREVSIGGNEGEDVRFDIKAEVRFYSLQVQPSIMP